VLARLKGTPPAALVVTTMTVREVAHGLRLNAALERRLLAAENI
jgi:hypothetical protein